MTDPSRTLLIRAHDAGDTYISFRWLDEPARPTVHRVPAAAIEDHLALLDVALPAGGEQAVRRALSGPLTQQAREYELSSALSQLLLPQMVRDRIVSRAADGLLTVRITPSRALSRIPYEMLVIDPASGGRLLEVADIVFEPPAAIHVGRSRIPVPWSAEMAAAPTVYVVDPLIPASAGLRPVLGHPAAAASDEPLRTRIKDSPHSPNSGVGTVIGRWELSDDLRSTVGRLFYLGHVSSSLDQPGSASLHLSDDGQEWGLAAPMAAHRPLSALDLLLGTQFPELGPDCDPIEPGLSGPQLWPMPTRVALVACEGGVDFRSAETFGLLMAMFNAGAEVITTTRWTLPSDYSFATFAGATTPGPTTELALAVDDAQAGADPAAALGIWQRARLAEWRTNPTPATSPLTWAAVGTYLCPPREVGVQ